MKVATELWVPSEKDNGNYKKDRPRKYLRICVKF